MLKNIWRFFKIYKQLGFVLLTVLIAFGLYAAQYYTAGRWVLGVSALINAVPLLWEMVEDIRSGRYGIDLLAATAIITSVLLQEYWAGIVVVLMLTGGKALEDYAEQRAKEELSSLLERKPKKAHVMKKSKIVEVNVSDIVVGDKVVIVPGGVVPVDGEIIEGGSSFDESDLTGESLPVSKQKGDQVLSGSINIEGAITIRAVHTAQDSQYEQIIKLVKSAAAATQSPFVRLADRYSIPFTVAAFIIAGAVWIVTGQALRFLEVIIVATPCPLLLAAPIALISGMSRAAKHGIIVKTGSALERLAEIETMAFDKTGTLTRGAPVMDKITAYNNFSNDNVLTYAAAIEQSSGHVLAKTIIDAAHAKRVKITPAKQVKEISGQGLSGRLQGKTILVGRLTLMKDHQVTVPPVLDKKSKQTISYVAVNDVLAGVIEFKDEVRPESKKMLSALKKLGIRHTLMVTGDNAATANTIAKTLGIETVVADCMPGDKILALENVVHKPVGFVGDGVNDAPVLTSADVGIALGVRGSTAASESADIVIMLDDVNKVAEAVAIAKRTFAIGRQSILIGIFISLGLMGVFATGHFKPVYGAALQELVDVTVIFNALRAHGSFKKQ